MQRLLIMLRAYVHILFCCASLPAASQDFGVVADMHTRLPLRGVTVRTSSTHCVVTDWRGHYHLDREHHGATFSCVGYMARTLSAQEMRRDTVWLMPLTTKLDGVVVYAPKADLKHATAVNRDELRMSGLKQSSGVGMDFFGMFDRRVRHVSPKERARQKRILENY